MEKRDQDVHFLASRSEAERIRQKMELMGFHSMGAYLRKMALDGYCVKLELDGIDEMRRLLRICSNNLNQYAKKANETGSVYAEDIRDLQGWLEDIWKTYKEMLAQLAGLL